MSLRRNETNRNSISTIAGDFWLKYNKHRKAENMTGQLVSDRDITRQYRRNNVHLFTDSKAIDKPAPRKSNSTGRGVSTTVEQYGFDKAVLKRRLLALEFVSVDSMGDRSMQTVANMVKKLREEGVEILTVATVKSRTLGWILKEALPQTK